MTSETERREAGQGEWAAPSQKNFIHVRPDSDSRDCSVSGLRESGRHLRAKGNLTGEDFNLHAFSQQRGEDYWWCPQYSS